MRRLLLLLLLIVLHSRAATINADSASHTDVTAAIAAASDGDTVVIPSGTALYTSALTLTKAITLQGAGIGQTIIQDGLSSYGAYLLNVTLVEDLTTRITGIEFEDGAGSYGAGQANRIRISGTSIDDRRIRIDNCKFDSLCGPVFVFYTCLGVVDDNIILGKSSGIPAFLGHVINSSWGRTVDTSAWGDGAFTNANEFGSERFLFFEDNKITNLYAASALTMLDGHSGSRYVVRSNVIHKGSFEIHGPEAARTRGGRAFEVYRNVLTSDGSRSSPLYMRGGVGVVWSNAIDGWTTSAVFSLLDNRTRDNIFAPFNGADGRNGWDKNNVGTPFDTGTATSAGTLTVTASAESWTPDAWIGYTVRRTSGKAVASLTRSGSTCTVTSTGHGFSTGNKVSIWGSDQYPFNGTKNITVTGSDTFTFTSDFLPAETTATGTIKCALGHNFALILDNTGTQLTFADAVSGTDYRLIFAAADTFEINKVDQSMDQIGVIGGTSLDGVNVPTAVWSNTQTVSPWYEWNNYREAGADVDFSTGFSGGVYPTIVSGTHFHNDTPAPGYTPYTYPHPLRGEGEAPATYNLSVGTLNVNNLIER